VCGTKAKKSVYYYCSMSGKLSLHCVIEAGMVVTSCSMVPFPRHPELHHDEISAIQEMFDDAKQKGWLS
jgi:hypothetical protein